MSAPIIITIPKSGNTTTFRDYVGGDYLQEITLKGRKRRLDHLTWEEKLQRKKLKNRVAAQTSRDRKKAKMEEMETTVQLLCDKNEALLKECRKLRDINKKLINENADLQNKLSSCSGCCRIQNRLVDCNSPMGPAVSTDPLPQGQEIQPATVLNRRQTTLVIMKIVLACLLYQTSSPTLIQNSTLTNLKSSLKAYSKISPQIWKQLLQKDRLQKIVSKKITQKKWWGRHQCTWNPVEANA